LKKILLFSLIFLSVFVYVGCVEGEIYVDVDRDGSAEVTYELLLNERALNFMQMENEDPLQGIKEYIQENDAAMEIEKIEEIQQDGREGIKMVINYEDVSSISLDGGRGEKLTETEAIDVKRGFFKDYYMINLQFQGDESIQENEGWLEQFGEGIVKGMIDFNITFDLPIEAKSHNADIVEGNVYTWNADLIHGETIEMELEVWNVFNIALLVGAILIVSLGLIVTYVLKLRKKE